MNTTTACAFPVVSDCAQDNPGTEGREQSSGKLSRQKFPYSEHAQILHRGVPFDPDRFRALFPDRWRAFLHAHHRSIKEVAAFYNVTDKAARKWWDGVGGPQGDKVALAAMTNPEGFKKYLVGRE